MHYIVLDLEWNQPISFQSRTYRDIGDRLMFEMIQIGAVKLDDQLNPADSVSIPISPTHYQRIHPRIRRMTGLDEEVLAGAPSFREALTQFSDWCGTDYVLLTWGCDDVSVLAQNIDFFQCHDIPLAPLCDIQPLFSQVHHLKDRSGLKAAMELLQISPDENRHFHNALNDAWYTALVFRTLPDPTAVLQFVQKPRKLNHGHRTHREKFPEETFATISEALASDAAQHPVCPRCGRDLKLDGEYIKQGSDRFIIIAKCSGHGRQLIRLRLQRDDDDRWIISRTTAPASSSQVAYVHTKQLQAQQRQQAAQIEDMGAFPSGDLSSELQ